MISSRLWFATLLALSWPLVVLAQTESTSESSGPSGPVTPGAGAGTGAGTTPTSPANPPSSSFSSTIPSTGSSSAFGSESGSSGGGSLFDIFSSGGARTTETPSPNGAQSMPQEAPPSFTLPGFYGQGSTTFFGGSGRLARPVFEMGLSFSIGYDDNIFQTPSETFGFGGAQFVDPNTPGAVKVEGEDPSVRIVGYRRVFDGQFTRLVPIFETQPGTPDTFSVEPIEPDKRTGSFLTRSNLSLEIQRFTRRSLFTLDFSGGRTFYWDKDEDPIDYNANFSAAYQYRFSPRLQTTFQVNAAYLSQPDLSRINTPERPTRGDTINTLARGDLTYRFTPRISATTTASYAGLIYTDKAEEVGNYDQWTLGLEGRYLWKPRWTLLAEVRHTATIYEFSPQLDATTEYLLVGSEFILSSRLSGTLKMGVNYKTFDVGGDQLGPYVESSVSYRSTARSTVSWTNRFGFEEAGSPDDERMVYRSSIGYTYAFTPRLRGFASINLLHEITTNKVNDTEFAQDTFDSNIGLDYQLTKRFGLNASYAFTITNSNTGTSDYYRNRVYFGGQISF